MAVNERNLCMGCMSPLFEGGKCSVCGCDENAPANIDFLPPRSHLGDRYIVGKLIASDPEGAWYVGYDRREETRVWVREYAPGSIIRRDHANFSVRPLASSEAQYKALMSDFEDLCGSIRRLPPGEKVIPILDVVRANNTMYAIYRYIKTITLESFLRRSGGKLSWRHTKKLLMPLYHTVANIHKAGLIHRGLSPQTIHLDQSGALWLSCFTVAAARTNKSELSAQLFEGYAAPEQYSLNSWQGTWTDVYALGALTYHTVTGVRPPSAQDRVYGDDLLDSQMISGEMPAIVVNAINHALAVEVEDRTQTAERYIADLLANEDSNTAVYTAAPRRPYESEDDSRQRREIRQAAADRDRRDAGAHDGRFDDTGGIDLLPPVEDDPPAKTRRGKKRDAWETAPSAEEQRGRRRKHKRAHPVLSLILSALVATALLGFAVYWFANNYLYDLIMPSSSGAVTAQGSNLEGVAFSDSDGTDDGMVPRFVGATVESIQGNQTLNQRFTFSYKDAFNDVYEEGVVFDQQPVEGTKMPNVGQVTLFVSKGPEKVEMPDLVNKTVDEAAEILAGLELKAQVIEVYDKSYKPGIVARTDPKDPGAMLDKNKDTVFLYTRMETASDGDEEEDEGDRPQSSSKKSGSSRKSSSSSKKDSSSSRMLKPKGDGFYDDNGNWVQIFD